MSTARGETGLHGESLAKTGLVELDASGVLQSPLCYSKLWPSLVFFGIAKEQAVNQKHHRNTRWKPKRHINWGGACGPKPGGGRGSRVESRHLDKNLRFPGKVTSRKPFSLQVATWPPNSSGFSTSLPT